MEGVVATFDAGFTDQGTESAAPFASHGLDSPSMQEAIELWLGQHVPTIAHISGPFCEDDLHDLPREVDIFTAAGDHGPMDRVPQIFQRLSRPVFWAFGQVERNARPTQVATALQLIKDRNIYIAGRDVLHIYGFDFCGPLPGEAGYHEGTTPYPWDVKEIIFRHKGVRCATAEYEVRDEDDSAYSSYPQLRSKQNPLFPRPWNPRIVLSHDKCVPADEKIAARLAQIGSHVRAAKTRCSRKRQDRMARLQGLAPPALIHLHSDGADTPLFQGTHAFAAEQSLLTHRFEIVRRSGGPKSRKIRVFSASEVFFSVCRSHTYSRDDANLIPHLNGRLAYWCRCVTLARTTLGSEFLRFAIENLPLDAFASNRSIAIGVLVEGLSDDLGKRLAARLNALRPLDSTQPAHFVVCPVPSMAQAREVVPVLSDDALDAAFEAVML